MSRRKRQYFTGTFTLSREHIELSKVAGKQRSDLIDEYLTGIEIDNLLKPKSLDVYYYEMHKDYDEYFFTEIENKEYIQSFLMRIFNLSFQGNSILN